MNVKRAAAICARISKLTLGVLSADGALTISTDRLHQFPSPPELLFGRAAAIRDLLTGIREQEVALCGLFGVAGVGKTALALEIARQVTLDYPDAQCYLDLQGGRERALPPVEAMAAVIHSFYPEMKLPDIFDEVRGLYYGVLSDKRALLLFDDARDAAQVIPLLPPPGCLALITSRQSVSLPGMQMVEVATLANTDAADLLRLLAPRTGDAAPEIARLCGELPLALRIIGAALSRRGDIAIPITSANCAPPQIHYAAPIIPWMTRWP